MVDSFYGSIIDQLVRGNNKMIFLARCFIQVDTVNKIYLVAPEKAEFETGFQMWIMRVANLSAQIGARLVILAYRKTAEYIRAALVEGRYEVRFEFRQMDSWDDFILLSGEIAEDDLLIAVSARRGSLSYGSDVENMPAFLQKNFTRQNLLIVYPRQF